MKTFILVIPFFWFQKSPRSPVCLISILLLLYFEIYSANLHHYMNYLQRIISDYVVNIFLIYPKKLLFCKKIGILLLINVAGIVMINSNFIEVVKSFSPKEIKRFSSFLESPYFNSNKKLSVMFRLIKEGYPEFESENISNELIYKKLYPGKKYKDTVMRNLNSDMFEMVMRFLAAENIEKDEFTYDIKTLEEVLKRKLYKFFNRRYNLINNKLSKASINEYDIPHKKYLLGVRKSIFDAMTVEFGERLEDVNILSDELTAYYVTHMLGNYQSVLGVSQQFKTGSFPKYYDEVIKLIKGIDYKKRPFIHFMYMRIMLYINPEDESNFNSLINFLNTYEFKNIDKLQQYSCFMALRQFCSNKLNRGVLDYRIKLFNLYGLMLDLGIYKKDKYIVSALFENILHAALRVDEIVWAGKFIENYKKDLNPDETEYTLYYCNSVYCYYKGEFEKALEGLSTLKKNPLPYENLATRVLYLKIYYEVNDIESIISSTETLKKYLKNESSISQDLNIRHKNFIDLFIKLYEVRENSDGYKLKLFLQELDNTNPVADKLWFYEKYNELQK